MAWKWNWNAIWIAGVASLLLGGLFGASLGFRILLYPIAIMVYGFIEGARASEG